MSTFETFGKYRLTERLAIGGMAEVFLGSVEGAAGFTKQVVIKRLHPQYSRDKAFIQMLIDEARLTSQLNHGNICQVYDLGEEEGSYYMALEYIAGEDVRTLQDHCRRAGDEFPIAAAVHIVSESLAGLDFAHRKEGPDGPLGIIHRDVSPQNILISYEGEVKVIDFGIAKARTRMIKETEAGVIKGKFRYMSPEQASGLAVDARTDVFAAGVVLYELLAGETHSLNLPDTEVLRRMRAAEFEPLRKRRRGIPGKLEKVVHKALARKPSQRYATAAEFRAALFKFLQSRKVTFGSAELSALMGKVFGADRRKRREGSFSGVLDRVSAATNKRNAGPAPASTPGKLPGPLTPTGTEQLDDEVEISTSALVELEPSIQPPPAPSPTMDRAPQATVDRRPSPSGGWVAFAPTTPFGGDGEVSVDDIDDEATREVNMPPANARPQQPSYVHVPDEEQGPIGDSEGTALFMSLDEDDLEFMEEGEDEEPTTHVIVDQDAAGGLGEEKTRAIKRSAIERQRPDSTDPLSSQSTAALDAQPTAAVQQAPAAVQQAPAAIQQAPAAIQQAPAPVNLDPTSEQVALSREPTAQLDSAAQPSVVVGPSQPAPSEPAQVPVAPAEQPANLPSVIVDPPGPRRVREPTSMLDPRRKEPGSDAYAATAPQHHLAATQAPAPRAPAPQATAALAPQPSAAPEPAREPTRQVKAGGGGALRTILGGLVVIVFGGALALGLLWWRPAFLFMETPDARVAAPADAGETPDTASNKPGPGQFRVQSKPSGAAISLCGKPTGESTPATLDLPKKKDCVLVLTLPDHAKYQLPASVLKESDILQATLRPKRTKRRKPRPRRKPVKPAPTPPPTKQSSSTRGTLVVTSVQVGKVYINDQFMGDTPRFVYRLRPGRYRVRVQFPSLGTGTSQRIISIRRGKTFKMHVEP